MICLKWFELNVKDENFCKQLLSCLAIRFRYQLRVSILKLVINHNRDRRGYIY